MPEVKRRELQVRSKDTFTAIQWFKHGDHEKVTQVPRGTSSYQLPPNSDVTEIGWLSDPSNRGIGNSVSPGEWIVGPMERDDGEDYYEVLSPETFQELFEEVPTADAVKAPAVEPAGQQKKGTGMRR